MDIAAYHTAYYFTIWHQQVSEAGVHRPHVAGIAARENEGAFSIVLSGGYEDDVVSMHSYYNKYMQSVKLSMTEWVNTGNRLGGCLAVRSGHYCQRV